MPLLRAANCVHRDRAIELDESPAVADCKREQVEVEQHRSRLLEKLGVSSVTELMRLTFDRPAE